MWLAHAFPARLFGYVLLLLPSIGTAADTVAPPANAAVAAETAAQKAERMKWWTEARFGMFIHWGPVASRARRSAGPAGGKSRFRSTTTSTRSSTRPSLTPGSLSALPRKPGVKYIALTTKHHDGFSMFATKLSRLQHHQHAFQAGHHPGTGRGVPSAGPAVLHVLLDHRLVSPRLPARAAPATSGRPRTPTSSGTTPS